MNNPNLIDEEILSSELDEEEQDGFSHVNKNNFNRVDKLRKNHKSTNVLHKGDSMECDYKQKPGRMSNIYKQNNPFNSKMKNR